MAIDRAEHHLSRHLRVHLDDGAPPLAASTRRSHAAGPRRRPRRQDERQLRPRPRSLGASKLANARFSSSPGEKAISAPGFLRQAAGVSGGHGGLRLFAPLGPGADRARPRGEADCQFAPNVCWRSHRRTGANAQSRLKPPHWETPLFDPALRVRAYGRDPVRAIKALWPAAHQRRTQRPYTWPRQPALQKLKNPLATGVPSTQGRTRSLASSPEADLSRAPAANQIGPVLMGFRPKSLFGRPINASL